MRALSEAGVPVTSVSDVTGFPECLDGRVKTLHPAIHAGLLAMRSNPEHMKQIEELGIKPIDMVVINLYPFRQTIAKPGVKFEDAIENIDIGGPTMIRAAAKNWQDVAVVVDPADYSVVLDQIKGDRRRKPRNQAPCATKVFAHRTVRQHDLELPLQSNCQASLCSPPTVTWHMKGTGNALRRNPHQAGAFYRELGATPAA